MHDGQQAPGGSHEIEDAPCGVRCLILIRTSSTSHCLAVEGRASLDSSFQRASHGSLLATSIQAVSGQNVWQYERKLGHVHALQLDLEQGIDWLGIYTMTIDSRAALLSRLDDFSKRS